MRTLTDRQPTYYIAISLVFILAMVLELFVLPEPTRTVVDVSHRIEYVTPHIPATAPLVVRMEICDNVVAPATSRATVAYATCILDVNEAWHDERGYR